MIRAGTVSEIAPSSGEWLVLDIGFANESSSCGLLINGGHPVELRFSEAKEKICGFISTSAAPVNLLIEAPLSVAFDRKGNPKGRAIEKRDGKTRYWYVGLGCTVMVATFYLLEAIVAGRPSSDVRLFEGFVSFKIKGVKSNHARDVELLWEVVRDRTAYPGAIVEANALKMTESDTLQSAFLVAGINAGIPPIIMQNT
ncbi:MAG: hypothetical protein SWC96_12940 [Thermodesulfobacteriota bacterium]|nr:hypothetical protein [Thermodesulfobacteriota bacterium]